MNYFFLVVRASVNFSHRLLDLSQLEEHVKALMAEKDTLQREIDDGRAILDGADEDVENRRKLVEEYAEMKADMRRYGIGPEHPRKIQTCLQRLKDANYDAEEVMAGYANMEALRKERMEFDEERLAFEARLATVKEVLPLAEQITQLKIGIGELLAFHCAVYEKADMERIPLDTAAYKIVEHIQDYSQLGGLRHEQNRLQQQIFMSNMIMTTRQQALVSLMRLQALGVSDTEIKNMAQLMDFGSTSLAKENKNGNTKNGWPTF